MIFGMRGHDFGRMEPAQLAEKLASHGARATQLAFGKAFVQTPDVYMTDEGLSAIRKTFEAVKGAPHAVIHLYNSTSVAQREQVFKKSKEEIKQLAVDGAELLKKLADETDG